jgi:anti-anti-sigma factor
VALSIVTHAASKRQTTITLRGEIDYESAQELRSTISEALRRDGIGEIVVSLAEVTFLDSTGIGTLVVAVRICTEVGVGLRVRDANPLIRRLFTVVGVAAALGLDEAVEAGARPTNGSHAPINGTNGANGAKVPAARKKQPRAYSMER